MKELSTEQLIKSLDVHLDTSLTRPEIHVNDLTAYRDRLKELQLHLFTFTGLEEQPQTDELTDCKDALISIINLCRLNQEVKDTTAWKIAYEVCNAKGYI